MSINNSIDNLIYVFSKLPGLGPRSARRIVLHLLEDKNHRMNFLSDHLITASKEAKECSICFNIDNSSVCRICSDDKRDQSTVAIVENIGDLWALERSNHFNGLYHVLGCNLNATQGKNPEDLKLNHLLDRINQNSINEVIIATNTTIDGQTTAFYITEYLKESDIKISRLASGIPIGGELDYLDEGTLSAALSLRQPF